MTLPGIAAILLGIGMAVDANVISFERVKERLKIGDSLEEAFVIGNKSSFSSIIDANITTMIVAVIIFVFGESSVKGFATMLIISIIVTVLVMVFFTKFVLSLFVKSGFFNNKLGLFVGVNKKKIVKSDDIIIPFKKLEFVRNRKFFLTGTVLLLVIGMIVSFTKGANLGVDFLGGTSITVSINENVSLDKIENDLQKLGYNVNKYEVNDEGVSVVIKEVLNKEEIESLNSKIQDKYDTDTNIYTVSKVVKQELIKNAIYSVVLAGIGILIYVSFRFKFNYAVAAVVALVHDVVVIILFFCIFRLEINTLFIAAVLTIIGYSINDTIVTFDMIRENYKKKLVMRERQIKECRKENKKIKSKNGKKSLDVVVKAEYDLIEIVNDSVRITFFRSILTTVTTIVPVICLMILGAREIFNFNIALLVGFIAGVYSSIYISNQLWLILESRSIRRSKKDKSNDVDEVDEVQVKGVNC